jgi:Tfp pilus assembly protein PilF
MDWPLSPAEWQSSGIESSNSGEMASLVDGIRRTVTTHETDQISFGRSQLLLDVFLHLARSKGAVEPSELYESCWQLPWRPPSSRNALHVSINRLRKKLEGTAFTLRQGAQGYQLAPHRGLARTTAIQPPSRDIQPPVELIGRQKLSTEMADALATGAVCLFGGIGVGKTALATTTSPSVWVSLASCDASTARTRVARALGQATGSSWSHLFRVLSTRNGLTVLDGADVIANEVATRLQPQMRVLVTSRQRIPANAAHLHVQPLSPANAASLVQQVARKSGVELTDADSVSLAAACDDNPLLIELVAAQTHRLSPSTVLARVTRITKHRLQELVGAAYEALPTGHQSALRLCCCFDGSFQLASAERLLEVDDWPLDVLDELERAGWLTVHEGDQRSVSAPIRLYEATRTPDPGIRHRFLRAYTTFASTRGHASGTELTELQDERRQVKRALGFALDRQDTSVIPALVLALNRACTTMGLGEGCASLFERSLSALAGGKAEDIAWARLGLAGVYLRAGDSTQARALLEQITSVDAPSDLEGSFVCYTAVSDLAMLAVGRGDMSTAEALCRRALSMRSTTIPVDAVGMTYHKLGMCLAKQGRFDEAAASMAEAIGYLRRGRNLSRTALALSNRAMMAAHSNHQVEAIHDATQGLQAAGDSAHPDNVATRCQCHWVLEVCGQKHDAAPHLEGGMERLLSTGHHHYASRIGARLAWLNIVRGDMTAAQSAIDRLTAMPSTAEGLAAQVYLSIHGHRVLQARGQLEQLRDRPEQRWFQLLSALLDDERSAVVASVEPENRVEWRFLANELEQRR